MASNTQEIFNQWNSRKDKVIQFLENQLEEVNKKSSSISQWSPSQTSAEKIEKQALRSQLRGLRASIERIKEFYEKLYIVFSDEEQKDSTIRDILQQILKNQYDYKVISLLIQENDPEYAHASLEIKKMFEKQLSLHGYTFFSLKVFRTLYILSIYLLAIASFVAVLSLALYTQAILVSLMTVMLHPILSIIGILTVNVAEVFVMAAIFYLWSECFAMLLGLGPSGKLLPSALKFLLEFESPIEKNKSDKDFHADVKTFFEPLEQGSLSTTSDFKNCFS